MFTYMEVGCVRVCQREREREREREEKFRELRAAAVTRLVLDHQIAGSLSESEVSQ